MTRSLPYDRPTADPAAQDRESSAPGCAVANEASTDAPRAGQEAIVRPGANGELVEATPLELAVQAAADSHADLRDCLRALVRYLDKYGGYMSSEYQSELRRAKRLLGGAQ
jgi:hypothetical protein